MEMPHTLKTLPPEALDALRYFGRTGQTAAYPHDIVDGSGLSDRALGKAIRRLVTKSYMMLDGSGQYRLTENGRRLLASLLEYDLDPEPESSPGAPAPMREAARTAAPAPPRFVRRRVVLVAPQTLVADQPTNVYVGFHAAETSEQLTTPLSVRLRLCALHGEPGERETALLLENRAVRQVFEVTAGAFRTLRIRVLVLQEGASEDEAGGLYLDLPVNEAGENGPMAAFGSDLMLMVTPEDDETARYLAEFDF
jgi:hypothetical protein